jgi:DNA-binding response OmpR family regulator
MAETVPNKESRADTPPHDPQSQFRVLLVQGDHDLAQPNLVGLERAGLAAHYAPDMAGGLQTFVELDPHLIIIDLDLPNSQAPSLCRTVRHLSNMPLMLTGADSSMGTQVQAFNLGADDYIMYPCDPRLLVGRAAALLRRSYRYSQPSQLTGQRGVSHSMPASPQHARQHGAHVHGDAVLHGGTTHRDTTQHETTRHLQSQLPKDWATCDTCDYMGPLKKFKNFNSNPSATDLHTVLRCPNCQREEAARFTVG